MTLAHYFSEIQKPRQQIYAGLGIPLCYAWFNILYNTGWMIDYYYSGIKYWAPKLILAMFVLSFVWAIVGFCYLLAYIGLHALKRNMKNAFFTSCVMLSSWMTAFALVQILILINY